MDYTNLYVIADAVLKYAGSVWCEQEFETVFPGEEQRYMWNERGDDFLKFYRALDPVNASRMLDRIKERMQIN